MRQSTLTKKQLAVIDDMFAGEMDIDTILKGRKVSQRQYNRWLADENFKAEFIHRIEWLNLQSQALIARYASLAAAKLVALTDSENQETRRKACLDIISLPQRPAQKQPPSPLQGPDDNENIGTIPPKIAGRLLEILAQEQQD